jgi:hypothetical protein
MGDAALLSSRITTKDIGKSRALLRLLHALLCGRKSGVIVHQNYPAKLTALSIPASSRGARCATLPADVRIQSALHPRLPPVQATALAHLAAEADHYRGFASLRPCARVPGRAVPPAGGRLIHRGAGRTR